MSTQLLHRCVGPDDSVLQTPTLLRRLLQGSEMLVLGPFALSIW